MPYMHVLDTILVSGKVIKLGRGYGVYIKTRGEDVNKKTLESLVNKEVIAIILIKNK